MHDTLSQIPSPCYVLEEELLRRNLALIRSVKEAAGVNIILAFKAYALWKSFPVIREYIPHSTASSIHEARLAFEEMGSPAHTYSPAYTERDFPTILKYSSHITFKGTPAATTFGGMSFVTTLPAPITELSPMVTPGLITT